MVFGMSSNLPARARCVAPALAAVALAVAPAAHASSSGGAGFAAINSSTTKAQKVPPPPSRHSHGTWLTSTTVTEYWPSPESWFTGKLVSAPGLTGKYPIDWLYSATGISMEGEGIGLDGQMIHINSLGDGGWVTAGGSPPTPCRTLVGRLAVLARRGATGGHPWRRHLSPGGRRLVQREGQALCPAARASASPPGASLPLKFLQSIAVDPHVIPLGSRVYIPAYRNDGYGGWFVAQDTGGAINGHHVDVYRRPPTKSTDGGGYLTGQRIYVIKPSK